MKKFFLLALCVLLTAPAFSQYSNLHKLSQRALDEAMEKKGNLEYMKVSLLFKDRVDVYKMDQEFYARNASLEERTKTVIETLKAKANATQGPIVEMLSQSPYVMQNSIKSYWITNVIFIEVRADFLLGTLLQMEEFEQIDLDAEGKIDEPMPGTMSGLESVGGHEAGHDAIKAPQMWGMGYTGKGRIGMGIDSGVNKNHPALSWKWKGLTAPLAQSWYVHGSTGNQPSDCDGSNSHGTHTMGTILGLDTLTNDTVGVAPDAEWIGSPAICGGTGTSDRIGAFQWAMDPDGNASTTADMPDAICNSWYDPGTVGECNGLYSSTFTAVEAAGVAIVFSAGNSGPFNTSITSPKNINIDLVNVFCVGNINGNNLSYPIASSSSRGPSTCGGTGSLLIKPEVVAPGTNVRSCQFSNGYGSLTGTSMAAPHVTGAILLLKEAFPHLTGHTIKEALYFSARDLGTTGEDNTYGMGLIDVPAAYNWLLNQGYTTSAPALDVAPGNIDGIATATCDTTVSPEFRVRNWGDSTITSMTVNYQYTGQTAQNFTWTGSLASGMTALVTMPTVALPSGSYTLTVWTSNPNNGTDGQQKNDTTTYDFQIYDAVQASGDSALCGPANLALTASYAGSGTITWFDAGSGGTVVGTGSTFNTPGLNNTTNYWVDAMENANVGPSSNGIGTGGYFTGTSSYLTFDADQAFTLKSVLVYANSSGTRTVQLRNSSGGVIQQTSVNVASGSSRITLNFNVPAGSGYELGTSGTPNLYRNSAGGAYPYTVPGVVSITGSSFGAYYYFFYDWEIEHGSPCGRKMVEAEVSGGTVAGFTPSPSTVTIPTPINFINSSSNDISWQWDFGDGNTSTLENPSHTYTTAGVHQVTLISTSPEGCTDTLSKNVTVNAGVGVDPGSDFGLLNVYPIPGSEVIWVDFELNKALDFSWKLVDMRGKVLLKGRSEGASVGKISLDVSDFTTGIYYFGINSNETSVVRKVLISR